jgi:hypothetical protein
MLAAFAVLSACAVIVLVRLIGCLPAAVTTSAAAERPDLREVLVIGIGLAVTLAAVVLVGYSALHLFDGLALAHLGAFHGC